MIIDIDVVVVGFGNVGCRCFFWVAFGAVSILYGMGWHVSESSGVSASGVTHMQSCYCWSWS